MPTAPAIGTPLPSLTRWGLSADCDLVYRTLIWCGPRGSALLIRELGLSRARVERALAELHDAGATWPVGGSAAGNWTATPIEQLLASLRKRLRPKPTPPAITPEYQRATADVVLGEGIRHLTTRASTRLRLDALVKLVRHEHLSLHPEQVFDSAAMQAAAPMDDLLFKHDVKVRSLGIQSPEPDQLVPYGGQVKDESRIYRNAPTVPMKLILLDRRVALFPVDPGNYEAGYLEVAQQPVVHGLLSLFEQQWAMAGRRERTVMPPFSLAPREQAVVAALVRGCTDASTARELRISERSVSTIVRSLMDRLNVDNRFQLGVALGALGLVPPPASLTYHNEEGQF